MGDPRFSTGYGQDDLLHLSPSTLTAMRRNRVLSAVKAMAASIATEADESMALGSVGFDPAEAGVIADLLPEAFALPAMETLGIFVLAEASVKDSTGQ